MSPPEWQNGSPPQRAVANEISHYPNADHQQRSASAPGRQDVPTAHGVGSGSLFVPVIDSDADTLTAALAYAKAGFYVVPLRRGTKHPGSVLGEGWQHKSSRDPKQLIAWFAGTDHGLALHVGRSGAVVFDVDTPERLPEVLGAAVQRDAPPLPEHPHQHRT